MFLADLFLILAATVLAVLLRQNFELDKGMLVEALPYFAANMAAAAFVLPVMGITRSMWRFSATPDYMHLSIAAAVIVSIAVVIAFTLNRMDGVARAVPVIQLVLMSSYRSERALLSVVTTSVDPNLRSLSARQLSCTNDIACWDWTTGGAFTSARWTNSRRNG